MKYEQCVAEKDIENPECFRYRTLVGSFIFFMMVFLTLTQSDPTNSVIYLYTFYNAGIVGGALYSMNKLTKSSNYWEDYLNGN